MKVTLVAVVLGLLVVGCDRSVDSDTSDTLAFGEEAMFQTTQVSDAAFGSGRGNGIAHDSTRHGRMLQILSDYLELSGQQVDSLHTYKRTLFSTLLDIRTRVHAGQIMREEARLEVRTAREQFMTSLRSVLTADQQTKLDEWLSNFWERRGFRHGPRFPMH